MHIDKKNKNYEYCRCETMSRQSYAMSNEIRAYQFVKNNKLKWSLCHIRMKTTFLFILSLVLFIGLFNNTSYALWPVIDPTEIAKTVEVIQQLKQQYDTLKEQYDQMKSQYKAITGNYGWGDLGNNLNDLKDRQWSANNWEDALKGLSGGNSKRYAQLWDQYKANHLILSEEDFSKGADANLAKNYSQNLKANQASSVMSDYEFEKINKHLQKAYELGKSIENANKNNDLKSAVDLNSRIELESTFISIEILRMQTLLNQQTSQGGAAALALDQEAARFNKVEED